MRTSQLLNVVFVKTEPVAAQTLDVWPVRAVRPNAERLWVGRLSFQALRASHVGPTAAPGLALGPVLGQACFHTGCNSELLVMDYCHSVLWPSARREQPSQPEKNSKITGNPKVLPALIAYHRSAGQSVVEAGIGGGGETSGVAASEFSGDNISITAASAPVIAARRASLTAQNRAIC